MGMHNFIVIIFDVTITRFLFKSLYENGKNDAFVLTFVLRSYFFSHKSLYEMDKHEIRSYSRSYSFYINPCAKRRFWGSPRLGFLNFKSVN